MADPEGHLHVQDHHRRAVHRGHARHDVADCHLGRDDHDLFCGHAGRHLVEWIHDAILVSSATGGGDVSEAPCGRRVSHAPSLSR